MFNFTSTASKIKHYILVVKINKDGFSCLFLKGGAINKLKTTFIRISCEF